MKMQRKIIKSTRFTRRFKGLTIASIYWALNTYQCEMLLICFIKLSQSPYKVVAIAIFLQTRKGDRERSSLHKVTQLFYCGGRAGLWPKRPKAVELVHGCEFRRQKLKEFLPDKIYFLCKLGHVKNEGGL